MGTNAAFFPIANTNPVRVRIASQLIDRTYFLLLRDEYPPFRFVD